MKKTVFTFIISSMLAGACAQVNVGVAGTNPPQAAGVSGKPYRNEISMRALRDFSQRFQEVTDAEWVIMRDGYSARFTKDSMRIRVDYVSTGHWLATMRYYKEKQLPRKVRSLVKSTYFDYTIELVIEVESKDKIIYEIHLEDATSLKNIRVCEDEITVVGEYDKG